MNTTGTATTIVERVLEGRGPDGAITATATVRYANGARLNVAFAAAGPLVLVGPPERQMLAESGRFGDFVANPTAWVRAFYATTNR
jgi:hypothetical protein